jgi:hypothetical protein
MCTEMDDDEMEVERAALEEAVRELGLGVPKRK